MLNNVRNRVLWLDILKIMACFCVIINHSLSYLFFNNSITNISVLYYAINFSICKIGVPIFIMITGTLLLKKEITYKNILKRILKIFIILFIVSFCLSLEKSGIQFNIEQFFKQFLEEPIIIPYWYLYMLIGLYVVIPFIKKMVDNLDDKDLKYFLLLFLIIPGLLPLLQYILNINFNNDFIDSYFPITVAYLVAGYYLSNIKLNKKYKNIFLLCFIFFIILFSMQMYISYISTGEISFFLDNFKFITTSIPAISIFYIIRYYFENKKFDIVMTNIITNVSLVTFGIYLFHYIALHKIFEFSITKYLFSVNKYLGLICLEFFCFAFCGILTYFLRKVPAIKKFL